MSTNRIAKQIVIMRTNCFKLTISSLLLMMICIPAWSYDITAKSVEGIEIQFTYINANECKVSDGSSNYSAISRSSNGILTIPSEVNGHKVTEIGDYSFQSCQNLTKVIIPEGVKSIGNHAFQYCYSMQSVVIPSTIQTIGYFSFHLCANLKKIDLPEGLKSIGQEAFWYCVSLSELTIPNSVEEISDYAFELCQDLKKVTIGTSLKSIPQYMFSGCSDLTTIIIPSNITSIGDGAFNYCYGLFEVYNLSEIELTIGDYSNGGVAYIFG